MIDGDGVYNDPIQIKVRAAHAFNAFSQNIGL